MLQNATPLRQSAPGPPNMSDSCVLCTAPATRNASLRTLFKCHIAATAFLEVLQNLHLLLTFGKVQNPLRLPRKTTLQRPKIRPCGVFSSSTFQRASRHNGVHFLNISTSKSAPKLVCFAHFDLEMCFAPQRRALFQQLNFQKCPEPVNF